MRFSLFVLFFISASFGASLAPAGQGMRQGVPSSSSEKDPAEGTSFFGRFKDKVLDKYSSAKTSLSNTWEDLKNATRVDAMSDALGDHVDKIYDRAQSYQLLSEAWLDSQKLASTEFLKKQLKRGEHRIGRFLASNPSPAKKQYLRKIVRAHIKKAEKLLGQGLDQAALDLLKGSKMIVQDITSASDGLVRRIELVMKTVKVMGKSEAVEGILYEGMNKAQESMTKGAEKGDADFWKLARAALVVAQKSQAAALVALALKPDRDGWRIEAFGELQPVPVFVPPTSRPVGPPTTAPVGPFSTQRQLKGVNSAAVASAASIRTVGDLAADLEAFAETSSAGRVFIKTLELDSDAEPLSTGRKLHSIHDDAKEMLNDPEFVEFLQRFLVARSQSTNPQQQVQSTVVNQHGKQGQYATSNRAVQTSSRRAFVDQSGVYRNTRSSSSQKSRLSTRGSMSGKNGGGNAFAARMQGRMTSPGGFSNSALEDSGPWGNHRISTFENGVLHKETVESSQSGSTHHGTYKNGNLQAQGSVQTGRYTSKRRYATGDLMSGTGEVGVAGKAYAGVSGSGSASYRGKHVTADASGSFEAGASAEGSAHAKMDLKKGEFEAGAKGRLFAGVRLYGQANANFGNVAKVNAYGEAEAGAGVEGSAGTKVNLRDGTVHVGADGEAFAGAKAEGVVEAEVGSFGGSVGGAVGAGIGISGELSAGCKKGKCTYKIGFGLFVGVGAEVNISMSVDFKKISKNILKGLKAPGKAIKWIVKQAKSLGRALSPRGFLGKFVSRSIYHVTKHAKAIYSTAKSTVKAVHHHAKRITKSVSSLASKAWKAITPW